MKRLSKVMSLTSELRCSASKRIDVLFADTRSILQRLRWTIVISLVGLGVYCTVAAISFLERLRTLWAGMDKHYKGTDD